MIRLLTIASAVRRQNPGNLPLFLLRRGPGHALPTEFGDTHGSKIGN
jgi:hypothetical protein